MLLKYLSFALITFMMTEALPEAIEVLAESDSQAVLPCQCGQSALLSPAIIWRKHTKGTVWRKEKSGMEYWGASWVQNGTYRALCPHSQIVRGDCSLQISKVREEDGGLYICKVDVADRIVEQPIRLRVIKVSFSPVVPMVGNDVSISCRVTPWPYQATVLWKLNNSTFRSQSGITSDTTKYVVTEKADVRLVGNWTCVVGYRGQEGRASAPLSMKGIVRPCRDNLKVYAAVGSAVTLPCVFSHDLNPSKPVWEKQKAGSLLKPAFDRLPPSLSSSPSSSRAAWDKSLSLREVGFEDEGRYRCSATVESQSLTRSMQLVVAKIDSIIQSKKRTSVTLTCQLTDTSEVTDYEWVHVSYDLNGTQSVGTIQKGKTLIISKMSDENLGEWVCRFYGKEGILGNVTYHVHWMGGLSGQKSTGGSQNTATVVGLSFLLLVLLLVLAQMYKNHQRRKRIFQYPAMETILHTISNEQEERASSRVKKETN